MGRLVIQELRNAGKRIRAFDLPSADFSPFDSDPEIEVAAGDITSPSDVAEAVDRVDTMIHLAAILPPLSEVNLELTNHVNVEGTRVLPDAVTRMSPTAQGRVQFIGQRLRSSIAARPHRYSGTIP